MIYLMILANAELIILIAAVMILSRKIKCISVSKDTKTVVIRENKRKKRAPNAHERALKRWRGGD